MKKAEKGGNITMVDDNGKGRKDKDSEGRENTSGRR